MPTYEYKCLQCEYQFEQILPISQRDTPCACPHCAGGQTKRIMSPIRHSFAEGHRPESSKPDGYWENAEAEKQKKMQANRKKILEQAMYNDPKCPEKYKGLKDSVK